MDIKTKEQRSYNMSKIKSENTKPEKLIFSMLKKYGYKFKRHYKILGKPDVVFPDLKVAVFVDGEFWHGKDFPKWKEKLSRFWIKKIGDNIKRDRKNVRELKMEGWIILRLWGKNISRSPDKSSQGLIKFIEKVRKSRQKPT